MKNISSCQLELPDCWEDLSYKEKIFTFGVLAELFAGTITPEVARIKMLIEYTGYKPSWVKLIKESFQKNSEEREIINFNLLKLSEELTFAFTVEENQITPNHVFKKNPVSFIKIGRKKYTGRRFEIDITSRTNITAREFSDCFDALSAMKQTTSDRDRDILINQICATLFPLTDNYNVNIISGHHLKMQYLRPELKFGIVFWFTGIVKYYTEHPVYGLLFSGSKQSNDLDGKIRLGMNEIVLNLKKEGYGDSETMNLNDYFDAQIKLLKDMINRAIADGMNPGEIAAKTGIPATTIYKLS